jgi:toxin ParE1/3/4
MAHRIVWSRTAERDLRSLVRYISKDSPQRAEAFGYRIIAQVEMLCEHPHLGREVPEFSQPELREVIVSPYRVVYKVNAEMLLIEILRVWHAARDTPQIG